jgi:hypothetical protein
VIELERTIPPVPGGGPRTASRGPASKTEPLDIALVVDAKTAGVNEEQTAYVGYPEDVVNNHKAKGSVGVDLKPMGPGSSRVEVRLSELSVGNSKAVRDLAVFDFPFPVREGLTQVSQPALYAFLIFLLAVVFFFWVDRKYRLLMEEEDKRLQAARARAERSPDQLSPAWELAGANLQSYFTINLAQVRQIFDVSVGVMVVGFLFVIWGVHKQAQAGLQSIAPAAGVVTVSGIITQFIGATFMVIYRSTMAQATRFVSVLDRINTIGVSLKVLDQIQESDPNKDAARERLINLLLSSKHDGISGLQQEGQPRAQPRAASRLSWRLTSRLPRRPRVNCRIVAILVSRIGSITTLPAEFITAIEIAPL